MKIEWIRGFVHSKVAGRKMYKLCIDEKFTGAWIAKWSNRGSWRACKNGLASVVVCKSKKEAMATALALYALGAK